MTIPHLRVVPSSGPPEPRLMRHSDGTYEEYRRPRRLCEGCMSFTVKGEKITYLLNGWWHVACAREHLANEPSAAAWFAVAEQIVRAPSHFKASEIKVVMQKMLDIASGPLDGDAA